AFRRQELQQFVLALNLSPLPRQVSEREIFKVFQGDRTSQFFLVLVKTVAGNVTEEALRRDLIRFLRAANGLLNLFSCLFVKRSFHSRTFVNCVGLDLGLKLT